MIYVTGDIHGDKSRFKAVHKARLKKNDTLIVCGDFGFVWDDSASELKTLQWIGKRKYTVVFVDGYNDNIELLSRYPQQEWNGGQTKVISGNLRMLMRGEVFTIDGKRVFAFGGGDSSDKEDYSAREELQLPSAQQMENGLKNLEAVSNAVDIVVTHDAPAKVKLFLDMSNNDLTFLHQYLETVKGAIKFSHWYFGRYHQNKVFPPCYTAVFTAVLPVK